MVASMVCFFVSLYLYNKFGGNGFKRLIIPGRFGVAQQYIWVDG